MRFGKVFYVIVLLICLFEIARLWNIVPPQMAAHFDIHGNPNHFVSKAEFFWYQIQTVVILMIVSLLPHVLFLVLPVSLINIPNRAYWLAPERRKETVSRLSSFVALTFGVILLAVQAAFEISAYANLQSPISFNAQLLLRIMLAALIIIGVLLFQLLLSFRLPAANN